MTAFCEILSAVSKHGNYIITKLGELFIEHYSVFFGEKKKS